MLTAFPIQSLSDSTAMVEFSRFPASLATAAEVYANLETAVRAKPESERGGMFDSYNKQMASLDSAAQNQLRDLRTALKLSPEPSDPSVRTPDRKTSAPSLPVDEHRAGKTRTSAA
jgi:hypothetical protein